MTSYLTRVTDQTKSLGRQIDEWANVAIYGGRPGQTVSEHAALDAATGKIGACVLCGLLSVIVQWRHCSRTLDPNGPPTPPAAYVRAGLAFLILFGWVGSAVDTWMIHAANWLIAHLG